MSKKRKTSDLEIFGEFEKTKNSSRNIRIHLQSSDSNWQVIWLQLGLTGRLFLPNKAHSYKAEETIIVARKGVNGGRRWKIQT